MKNKMRTVTLGSEEMIVNKRVFKDMLNIREEIESIIETLDIMNDKELMEGIERSKKDVKCGMTHELKNMSDLDKMWNDEDLIY